jgi:excisionase family DNA binding protein
VADKCGNLAKTTSLRKTYSVSEIAVMLDIGRNKAYELCNSGLFKVIRIGRSLKVVKLSFDTWLSEEGQ